jgi:hypothetical protein
MPIITVIVRYPRACFCVSTVQLTLCIAPSQPSWSLMQALLLLASYLHSVDTPTNPSRSQHSDIAMTTVGRFTASLVDVWATDCQASGDQHDSQAKVWDLRFLRWLLTLWTPNWDGLAELDQLIQKLQVCRPARYMTLIYLYPKPCSLSATLRSRPTMALL